MIADRTYRAASFLAARVKNRLRFAASTGHKATQVLAHRAFRLRGQEQTVSDGSWPASACSPVVTQSNPGLLSQFERVVYLGNSNQVILRLANGDKLQALVQNTGDELAYKQGDPVRVHLPAEALRVLTDTGTAPIDEDAAQPAVA